MGKELEIAECIRRMAGEAGNPFVICKAKNISESEYTCDGQPEDGSALITGIRLVSITGVHASTVVIPEDDSLILVGMLSNTDGYVMHCSKAKKLKIKVGDSTINITDGLIEMNGGNLHGLPVRDKVKDRLNKIEQDINNLKTVFSSWVVAPQDGGAALKAAAGSWFGQQLVQTQGSDIENTKITQ